MAPVPPTTTPQDVTGYLVHPAANRWHADPHCPSVCPSVLVELSRTVHGTRGLVAFAGAQATNGRAPCGVCAYDSVLDATETNESDGPGWHYLACALHERTAPCERCAALNRHAAATGAVVATSRGGVALLIPGASAGLDRQWLLLIRMELTMRIAPARVQDVAPEPRVWASAAELIAAGAGLDKALVLAAALHAAPALT